MNQHNFPDGKINNCQVCNSTDLLDVINLGKQPLANSLSKNIDDEVKIKKYPVNIIRCNQCTLLQIDYIVDQKKVYHLDYPYLPGITKTVEKEQLDLANYLYKKLNLKKDQLVVDIGSNDGSLLKHFKAKGLKTVGVEPTNISTFANKRGIKTIQSFFNEETSKNIIQDISKAKLITCTNVFAHMSTLGHVMDGIVNLLDEDGYFCFENHYIMEVLNKVQYDTFYHEHLRTYSLISLNKLFEMYNLNLFDAMNVSRYGGSIRCIVSKKKNNKTKRLKFLIEKEKYYLIKNSKKTYDTFVNNIIASKESLLTKIKEIKVSNKKIIAKSCPARAVVLLNYCGLNNTHIDCIAEQPTSLKLNQYVPGTKLKIVNEDILMKKKPDYILLLAWHLSKPIIKKWKKKGLKSKFIVPLPKIEII